MDRLILGTAQLGLNYGIANSSGQPDADVAHRILALAYVRGIRSLDTAQLYGDAETRIGNFHYKYPNTRFKIITKLRNDIDLTSSEKVVEAVEASQRRLGCSIETLMLHDSRVVKNWSHRIENTLNTILEKGLATHIGVSVYTPEEFAKALAIPSLTVIQAPFNLFDRRILDSGIYERASSKGRHIILRSIFLQGLLLMTPEHLPKGLSSAKPLLLQLSDLSAKHGISRLGLAIHFALESCPRARIVFGVERPEQLAEILKEARQKPNILKKCGSELNSIHLPHPNLADPRCWPELSP